MKVFVTGATGFIGRNFVEKVAELGWRCHCLVRSPEKAGWMRRLPGVFPVEGDLLEPSSYRSLLEEVSYVVHLAGVTKAKDREEYMKINAHGTRELARAVREADSVRKFLFVSSLAVAGPRTGADPAVEEDEPAPITSYGESKLLGERFVREELDSVPWVILRPPVVYGPYDRDVYLYFKMASRGMIVFAGNGEMELSIVHAGDLSEAIILSLLREESSGKTYYVSDGGVYRITEILNYLLELAGGGRMIRVPAAVGAMAGFFGDLVSKVRKKGVLINSEKVKEATSEGWVCSIEKIKRELGFVPRTALWEGLERTYRWYLAKGWL